MKSLNLFSLAILFGCAALFQSCGDDEPQPAAVDVIPNEEVRLSFSGSATDDLKSVSDISISGATLTSDRNGKSNSAYYFNGSAYISMDLRSSFNPSETLSISFWVKPDDDDAHYIFHEGSYNLKMDKYLSCGGGKCFEIKRSLWASYNPNGYARHTTVDHVFEVEKWSHVVATIADDLVKIYVDGELKDEFGMTEPLGVVESEDNKFYIGTLSPNMRNKFKGSLDDFRFYSRALTETEIELLYNN